MPDLVCCLSTGKGTWVEVAKLINNHNWSNIFLITNDFGKEKFSSEKAVKFILVDANSGIETMKKSVIESLKNQISTEVAVNFISGSGKEHMALLSALVSLGVGMRFIIAADSDIKEI